MSLLLAVAGAQVRLSWIEIEPSVDQIRLSWLEIEPGAAVDAVIGRKVRRRKTKFPAPVEETKPPELDPPNISKPKTLLMPDTVNLVVTKDNTSEKLLSVVTKKKRILIEQADEQALDAVLAEWF